MLHPVGQGQGRSAVLFPRPASIHHITLRTGRRQVPPGRGRGGARRWAHQARRECPAMHEVPVLTQHSLAMTACGRRARARAAPVHRASQTDRQIDRQTASVPSSTCARTLTPLRSQESGTRSNKPWAPSPALPRQARLAVVDCWWADWTLHSTLASCAGDGGGEGSRPGCVRVYGARACVASIHARLFRLEHAEPGRASSASAAPHYAA